MTDRRCSGSGIEYEQRWLTLIYIDWNKNKIPHEFGRNLGCISAKCEARVRIRVLHCRRLRIRKRRWVNSDAKDRRKNCSESDVCASHNFGQAPYIQRNGLDYTVTGPARDILRGQRSDTRAILLRKGRIARWRREAPRSAHGLFHRAGALCPGRIDASEPTQSRDKSRQNHWAILGSR